MKRKLSPGGILLIDNKNWQPVLQMRKKNCHLCYIENRPPVRTHSPHPLPSKNGEKYYYFDIAWQDKKQWVFAMVRLLEDDVLEATKNGSDLILLIHGKTVVCKVEDNSFTAAISRKTSSAPDTPFPLEKLIFPGWPIESNQIGNILCSIGMEDVRTLDKFETLEKSVNTNKKGLYDLIIATNPR